MSYLDFICWFEDLFVWPCLAGGLEGATTILADGLKFIISSLDYLFTTITGKNMLQRMAFYHRKLKSGRVSSRELLLMDRSAFLYPNLKLSSDIRKSFVLIDALRDLKKSVREEAEIRYCETKHKHLLALLWRQFVPDSKDAPDIPSEEWKRLGFQGTDPGTDFRGMGLFGLNQLLFFTEKCSNKAHVFFEAAQLEQTWFFPSIFSINVTGHVYDLLMSGSLDEYLFSMNDVTRHAVDSLYSRMFVSLCEQWLAKDASLDIMHFPIMFARIKSELEAFITTSKE